MVEPFSSLPAHFALPDGRGGMNSACGRSPAAADWLPLEAEKQGCGPFRGRDFPNAGKVTKGAPGEPSERFPWTPPPGQGGPIAPHWIPPRMLPGTVVLWRTPVPVPRKEDPMGETAARFLPWPSGKDSKGNRLGIGFLWRFLSPLSLAAKKAARRRQLDENIGGRDI